MHPLKFTKNLSKFIFLHCKCCFRFHSKELRDVIHLTEEAEEHGQLKLKPRMREMTMGLSETKQSVGGQSGVMF